MVPQVFLSLSGKDDDFVNLVWNRLPVGLALFYRKSFSNGASLLDEMERGIDRASIFVLFASRASLESCWVGFEIDQARLAKIQRRNLRTIIIPLSSEITSAMLPAWMQQLWVPRYGYNPKDVARYITQLLKAPPFSPPASTIRPIGRGQLLDIATQRLMGAVVLTGKTPNVVVFTGLNGIGRRTFARYFAEEALSSLPDLEYGPDIVLPLFADLADLYREIRQLIETGFSFQKFEDDLLAFHSLCISDQVTEVISSLSYFSKLGQAVFAMIGAGLFEERGTLKPWVSPLFQAMAANPALFLFLISNRQIGEDRLRAFPNVLQIHVPELRDADVRALITGVSAAIGLKPLSPTDAVIRAIGGHPDVAKAAVRLVAQRGEMVLDKSPSLLYGIQDEILSDNLDIDTLSDLQKELLCMLSWVPHLSGSVLRSVLRNRHPVLTDLDFVNAVDNLILGCLITPISNNLAMSPAIRAMFRRRYGFGPTNLLKAFSDALSEEWVRSASSGDVRADLFDAFVFMHALEGKALPPELRRLLLPSTLLEVLRDTYQRGHDEEDAWKRVIAWGGIARDMRMDDTVKEEILSTVVRAHIRLEEYGEAEAMLKEFDRAGYRSSEFLRGFSFRRQGKLREAVSHLREALASGKYRRFVVQELATCYQKLNMQSELAELTRRYTDLIEGNGVLLDFRIGVLITAKKINEAEEAIHKLQRLPQDDGRSVIRRAQIAMQEDRDYKKATEMLTELVQKAIGNPVTTRRWRAIAAANLGQMGLARQDIEFIRSRPGQKTTADRAEVYLHLALRDYDAAEKALERAQGTAAIDDDVLMARILEERAADVRTALSERDALRARALGIRARNRLVGDYDFEE